MTQDLYPSTDDAAYAPSHGESELTNVLRNSRARLERCHTRLCYIGSGGSCCAIGAVWAEEVNHHRFHQLCDGLVASDIYKAMETRLRDATKEAIALLNEVAAERHPEVPRFHRWSGPLEWVNQDWLDQEDLARRTINARVKAEVLAIYDKAIELSMTKTPEPVYRKQGPVQHPDEVVVTA